MIDRRTFLLGAASSPFLPSCALAQAAGTLTPEMFGARGDGRSDDTAAFRALAAAVNRQGGGAVALSRKTYMVGAQRPTPGQRNGDSFDPEPVFEVVGCVRPVIIRGNGATLRCNPGLRYGTWDVRTGRATRRAMPNLMLGENASPYRYMIKIEGCTGPVEVSDLELDGNLGRLRIGGPWGDTGHQLAAYGLALINNRGREVVRDLHMHHHALDGLYIDGVDADRGVRSEVSGVASEYNGRQGCSLVGGRGYDFRDCRFDHQGRGGLASAPGAGVDIEAERGKRVRDLSFTRCRFADNHGAGLVADSGDSEGVRLDGCTFIGTTEWAAWPNKPGFRFAGCTFVGPVVRAYGDARRPERATKFVDCSFRDDPALSVGGRVYGGTNPERPIADLPNNPGVRFTRCGFNLTHAAALPWTTNVTYEDCVLSQRSATPGYPRGTYVGRNRVTGKVDLAASRNLGELIVNGVSQARWRG